MLAASPEVPTKEEEEAVEAIKFAPRSMKVVVLLEVEGPFRAKVRHLEADGRPSPLVRQTEIQSGVLL